MAHTRCGGQLTKNDIMKTKQSTTEVLSAKNDNSHSGYARLGAGVTDIKNFKEESEKLISTLNEQILIPILFEIEKTCRENKWIFKSVYSLDISDKRGNDIYDTKLQDLVFWYEEYCELFPFIMCDKGRWVEGQTPLLQFFKPNLDLKASVLHACT